MGNRLLIVLAAAAVGTISACSAPPRIGPDSSLRVTIGDTTRTAPYVLCSQLQSYRTIGTGDDQSGIEAVGLLQGDSITPKWVKIQDFGGFTGSFWEGGVGSADASFDGDVYTFAGTAYGIAADQPNKPSTTSFKIVADC